MLLGEIAKTHGVRGELIIRTENPSYELTEDWESIFLEIDGILVPFFISSLRVFKPGEWVLKLDWYEDKNKAGTLVGSSVWIEHGRMMETEEETFLDELIGYEILDSASGKSGTITGYMDIPDNPLLEIETGGKKILIPAREELILEIDAAKRQIRFELPEGLV